MALMYSQICNINPLQLTNILADQLRKVRIIDCRSFLEYNDNHIVGAVNICCSKLIKRRLQQEKISLKDLLLHCRIEIEETSDVVVYDQRSSTADDVSPDSFIFVLLKKLVLVFDKVYLLSGGFVDFHSLYPDLCENKIWKYPGLTALSQPCLPTTSAGPTRILPFLYLGSEEDANNKELLQSHNITYELNVSNKCAKPDFISEGHFVRIPVNDSHNEKLLPYFSQTFQFVEKVRESNECVLVHCLAGISRSPTVAIAYVMRHLQMNCEDAYRYVKAKRATISPNFNFLGQLLEYEKQLISENILEKKHVSQTVSPYTTSQTSDFLLGPQPILSPTASTGKTSAKSQRLNLSLRLCPYSGSPSLSSPKDPSPTTAMARLQFDKPQGKENRTGTCNLGSPTSGVHLGLGLGIGFSLPRPTRLVKEQNVTSIQEEELGQWESVTKSVTRQSVSISFAKGFKSRKSSIEQYQQQCEPRDSVSSEPSFDDAANYGNVRKCRVHKIVLEGENKRKSGSDFEETSQGEIGTLQSSPSCSSVGEKNFLSAGALNSPLGSNRNYLRSDSVSTSGIGSEISEHDLLTSGSWDMNESGTGQDDGVFSDNYSLYSRSPKPSRQLQLWSSDSGHWSSTDDGVSSCYSSSAEVPSIAAGDAKSPEKRKCPEGLFTNSGQTLTNLEKRRSYAGGGSTSIDWESSDNDRHKRWSLAEDLGESTASSSQSCASGQSGGKSLACGEDSEKDFSHQSTSIEGEDLKEESQKTENDRESRGSSSSSSSNLNFGHHWFNLLSGRELTCCERQGDGLYRVHSCPGIIGYRDWLQIHNQVPDSPPEPISDSVLLKMRSCRNRSRNQRSSDQPGSSAWNKNRFSCGSIDYEDLWSKLQSAQDPKTDSSHSSSSTLASSSFSIVVQ